MVSVVESMSKRRFLTIYLSSIAIYFFLVGLQGMVMCDEGWVLTGYQQIFNDPESVEYLFLYYFSVFVGGCWNLLMGGLGIFAFRILYVLVATTCFYVMFVILEGMVSRSCIIIGTLLLLAISYYGNISFHHNDLSCLLTTIAAGLLYKGFISKKGVVFVMAGVVMGVNVFCRLPNVATFSMSFVIFLYGFHNKKTIIESFLWVLLGLILGMTSIITLMLVMGHWDVFCHAVLSGISAGTDPDSTHKLSRVIMANLQDYSNIIRKSVLIFASPLFLVVSRRVKLNSKIKIVGICIVAFSSLLLLYSNLYSLSVVYAFITVVCVVTIWKNRNKEITAITLISLVIIYTQGLGSDGGISNMRQNSVFLALPLACGIFKRVVESNFHDSWNRKFLFVFFLLLAGMFFLKGIKQNLMHSTYYEDSPRWRMTRMPKATLATTFLSPDNAKKLDDVVDKLSEYIQPDDYLLCIENIPMIHFLTKTRPYLYNPWVWTYDPSRLKNAFERAAKEHEKLPVVVCGKNEGHRWFTFRETWNNANADDSYIHKNRRIKQYIEFIKEKKYHRVWESECFEILLPPDY